MLDGPNTVFKEKEKYHSCGIFPHIILVGHRHLKSDDACLTRLSFVVDDASTIFYDYEAFGTSFGTKELLIGDLDEAGKIASRKLELGEHSHVFYYTSKDEIFAAETAIGKVSATHGISYGMPGPAGIHVDNQIRVNIDFAVSCNVNEATHHLIDVLRFLELLVGRPQNISKIEVFPATSAEHPDVLDVYWCMPPHRKKQNEGRKPHPADTLVRCVDNPSEFAKLLVKWLGRQAEWRSSRARFSSTFSKQNSYSTDRLVSAANMFDVMPESACPGPVVLDPDLTAARDAARSAFRKLPSGPERESVLSALGRIGKPSLKRKVRARAGLIPPSMSHKLPELELVIDHAIGLRNYYVHGSSGGFDYGSDQVPIEFLTNALEFIFGISDLVDSGWDESKLAPQGRLFSHPFGRFCDSYALKLLEMKAKLVLRSQN